MSLQSGERRATYDEIIADPLFRAGYDEVFQGLEPACDVRWSDMERLAYERGRQFGQVVRRDEGVRIPLTRGGFVTPRARLLLLLAFRDGDLTP